MNSATSDFIKELEAEWEIPTGFIGAFREGIFSQESASRFLELLRRIQMALRDETQLDRRLISLLWSTPTVMEWQFERVVERGGDVAACRRTTNEVWKVLEGILGVP